MSKLTIKLSGTWTGNIFVNRYWVETEKTKRQHNIKGVYDILNRSSSSERADISKEAAIDLVIYERYHQKIAEIWTGEEAKGRSREIKEVLTRKFSKGFQQEL